MDWLKDFWEWLVPGEDDKGILKNLWDDDDDLSGDYTTTYGDALPEGYTATYGNDLPEGYTADYGIPAAGTSATGETFTDFDKFMEYILGIDPNYDLPEGYTATYGDELPEGYTADYGYGTPGEGTSPGEATSDGGVLDALMALIGGKDGKGIMGLGKNMLDNDLVKILLGNYLLKKDKEGSGGYVPIGQEAYGGAGQNIPDYRVTNLQPALMPGVAYANVAQPETPPPPMRHGGIASLASQEGPGDITLAKLEPGEFVVTKKATDNIGAQNLYRMMKQAEGMG